MDIKKIIREELDSFDWVPKETSIKIDLGLGFEREINTEEAKEKFKNEVGGYYAIATPKGKESPLTILAYGNVFYIKQVLAYLNETGVNDKSDLYLGEVKYSKKNRDNVLSLIKYY